MSYSKPYSRYTSISYTAGQTDGQWSSDRWIDEAVWINYQITGGMECEARRGRKTCVYETSASWWIRAAELLIVTGIRHAVSTPVPAAADLPSPVIPVGRRVALSYSLLTRRLEKSRRCAVLNTFASTDLSADWTVCPFMSFNSVGFVRWTRALVIRRPIHYSANTFRHRSYSILFA